MLGYTESDLNEMINAVHDAKLYYLINEVDQGDEPAIIDGLLKTFDFLQGLWAEGYFDHA